MHTWYATAEKTCNTAKNCLKHTTSGVAYSFIMMKMWLYMLNLMHNVCDYILDFNQSTDNAVNQKLNSLLDNLMRWQLNEFCQFEMKIQATIKGSLTEAEVSRRTTP